MKVHIILCSSDMTVDQNDYFYSNPLIMDWNIPVLPQKDDLIDDSIIHPLFSDSKTIPEEMIDVAFSLSYFYSDTIYLLIDGQVVPELHLIGE